jgi:hypothetical protein
MLSKKSKNILGVVLSLSILGSVLPEELITVAAYADTNVSDSSKDVGDIQKFAKAKEKTLKFLSEYKFSDATDWRALCDELKNKLSSEGITSVGDKAVNKSGGEYGIAYGTMYLSMGNEQYSFPFSVGADKSSSIVEGSQNVGQAVNNSEAEEIKKMKDKISTFLSTTKDVGDTQRFAKAKEKALKFISEYPFTFDNNWSLFCTQLGNELSSEGVNYVGDSAQGASVGSHGFVYGTINLYTNDGQYSFPFSGEVKSGNENSKNKYVKDVNKAKEKTLDFISKYNFLSDIKWSDFCDQLKSEISDCGVSAVEDTADINKQNGVITGTIRLKFLDTVETVQLSAQAYDIENSTGKTIKWAKKSDGTWTLLINGQSATGWQRVNGKWYYLKENGNTQIGWFKDNDGKWYYFKNGGDMALRDYIDGYYINEKGVWVV